MRIVLKGGKGSGHFQHAGRPGLVGGSESGVRSVDVGSPKAVNARLAQHIKDFTDKYKDSKEEHGRLLDQYGSAWEDDFTGWSDGLNLPHNEMDRLNYRDGYFIHNHPVHEKNGEITGGWGFSIEDIAMAAKWDLDQIVVIGKSPDGKQIKYTLTKNPSQSRATTGEETWFGTFHWTHAGGILMNYAMDAKSKALEMQEAQGKYIANAYLSSYMTKKFAKDYDHKYTEEIIG